MHLNVICIYFSYKPCVLFAQVGSPALKINCSVTSQMRFSFGKEKLHTHRHSGHIVTALSLFYSTRGFGHTASSPQFLFATIGCVRFCVRLFSLLRGNYR